MLKNLLSALVLVWCEVQKSEGLGKLWLMKIPALDEETLYSKAMRTQHLGVNTFVSCAVCVRVSWWFHDGFPHINGKLNSTGRTRCQVGDPYGARSKTMRIAPRVARLFSPPLHGTPSETAWGMRDVRTPRSHWRLDANGKGYFKGWMSCWQKDG